jgi:hypothetical protein
MALRVTARTAMTRQVTALIERLNRAPGVLINGSAIGWYGLRGDEALTPFESFASATAIWPARSAISSVLHLGVRAAGQRRRRKAL